LCNFAIEILLYFYSFTPLAAIILLASFDASFLPSVISAPVVACCVVSPAKAAEDRAHSGILLWHCYSDPITH